MLFGIQLRAADRKITGSQVFGFKMKNRRAIANNREQEVIKQIGALREKGFSYEKIAEVLNSMDVATKKKTRWYPKTVRQICLRLKNIPD